IVAICAGNAYAFALKSDGTLWSWGYNGSGQLGDAGGTRSLPVRVGSVFDVTAVAAGQVHTLIMKGDGTVWSVGVNGNGQLGNNAQEGNRYTPTQVNSLTGVTSVAASNNSLAVVPHNGSHIFWGWGMNTYGQVGDGTTLSK